MSEIQSLFDTCVPLLFTLQVNTAARNLAFKEFFVHYHNLYKVHHHHHHGHDPQHGHLFQQYDDDGGDDDGTPGGPDISQLSRAPP